MPGNLLISLTWYSPPISAPAAHLLISICVFIPVHSHWFSARLSCVFLPSYQNQVFYPAIVRLLYLTTLCFDYLPVPWISITLPAPRRICLLYCLISRFWPCLPVPRILITLPAHCRIVCTLDRFPGSDPLLEYEVKLLLQHTVSIVVLLGSNVSVPKNVTQRDGVWKRVDRGIDRKIYRKVCMEGAS